MFLECLVGGAIVLAEILLVLIFGATMQLLVYRTTKFSIFNYLYQKFIEYAERS